MQAFCTKSIDWYEFESNDVKKSSKHLRPYSGGKFKFQKYSGTSFINPVQFFTVMARTAALKRPNWYEEKFEVASFWLRYSRHFTKGTETRLRKGSAKYYKDADRTYWASRLGETYGYIEMKRRGYIIIDHMENALKRISPHISITGGADYYCEGKDGSIAIAEFKGHIVNPKTKSAPKIKDQLSKALIQCEKISSFLPKGLTANTYAIATYIREAGDSSDEPSLIAIADPDMTGDSNITKEALFESSLRGNYGTWLQMMGLEIIGKDILKNVQSKIVEYLDFILVNFKGERYVFLNNAYIDNYPIGLNIFFGLEENIFKQIVITAFKGQPLSNLTSFDQLIKQTDTNLVEHPWGLDENSNNSLLEPDVYIFNDKTIAMSSSKLFQSDTMQVRWHFPFES